MTISLSLFSGRAAIRTAAAAAVAVRVAAKPENKGKLIVAILPDAGERYFSSALFENLQV